MRVHIEDGRAYLRRNPQEKWDAFSTGGRLPFHLMTREFIEKLKTHLTENGMPLANLTSALDGEAGQIFRHQYRSFRDVFPTVYVFPRLSRAEWDPGSPAWWSRLRNVFIAATREVKLRPKQALRAKAERRWGHLSRKPYTRDNTELFDLTFHVANMLEPTALDRQIDLSSIRLFTDDYAPVDTLVFDLKPENKKQIIPWID